MIEVEKNIDFLNLIAEAALDQPGDANRAWAVLAQCIDEGTEIPRWILEYLRGVAEYAQSHDPNLPVEHLGKAMGFYPDIKAKASKSEYDMIDVAATISTWRRDDILALGKQQKMDEYFGRYIAERLGGKDKTATIKSLYYKGLEALRDEIARNNATDS